MSRGNTLKKYGMVRPGYLKTKKDDSMNTTEKIRCLCSEANAAAAIDGSSSRDYLPIFKKVLDAIESAKDDKDVEALFAGAVVDQNIACLELLQFVCRRYQFPIVKERALLVLNNSSDMRTKTAMSHILAVYEKSWEDEDLYA
jgi:hypothetical protein